MSMGRRKRVRRGEAARTLGGSSVRVRSEISDVGTVANRCGGSMSRQIICGNHVCMESAHAAERLAASMPP